MAAAPASTLAERLLRFDGATPEAAALIERCIELLSAKGELSRAEEERLGRLHHRRAEMLGLEGF